MINWISREREFLSSECMAMLHNQVERLLSSITPKRVMRIFISS
jgi:hypothetical protein